MGAQNGSVAVVGRLVAAINAHDLDAMVGCFADGYVNESPVHPQRGFTGNDQVRSNWSQIFARVPDVRAQVLRSVADGGSVWTEWDVQGDRVDGVPFALRGVVIFGLKADTIASARFFLEPVEETSGDVDADIRRVTGTEGNTR